MSEAINRWQVPLADVTLSHEEIEAVTAVLKSGWLSMGPKTEEFEHRFAEFLGVKHAFAVANGTAALHLACESVGLKEGDEVLCPALTFVATANAILYTGARPVFIDINGPHDLNLSVADAAAKVTERTRAIMVLHYGGYPCDLDGVRALAAKYNLKIIEDCAHAPGAVYHSKEGPQMAGTIGDVGCFSFFPSKNLGAFGDAGLCTTNDLDLAEHLRVLRVHGGKPKYYHALIGGNFRIDELQAAILRVKLKHLDAWTAARQRHAAYYTAAFERSGLAPRVITPRAVAGGRHIFNQYAIRAERRDALRAALTDRGIGTEIYYPVPLHLQQCFAYLGHPRGDFPESERAAEETLALPVYPELSQPQLDQVVAAVVDFYS